jgi:hypothetical protein
MLIVFKRSHAAGLVFCGLLSILFAWSKRDTVAADVVRPRIQQETRLTVSGARAPCVSSDMVEGCVSSDYLDSSAPIRPFFFDAKTSLRSQIGSLEIFADHGDRYSSCVLARALHICMQRRYASDEEFPGADNIDGAHAAEIDKIEKELNDRQAARAMCEGLAEADFSKYMLRMVDSAKMGDTRSMARLTSFQMAVAEIPESDPVQIIEFYRDNAEHMLNFAALAGEPEAILSVYHAYSAGYLEARNGRIDVDIDLPKSLAAARTLAFYGDQTVESDLQLFIANMSSLLSESQLAEMRVLESRYNRNYRKKEVGATIHSNVFDDFQYDCAQSGTGTKHG